MTETNPFAADSPANSKPDDPATPEVSEKRAAYNFVSDVIVGVNIRKSDNLFQLYFTLISVVVFALVGIPLALYYKESHLPWQAGALMGAFAGLVFGTFASGIYLMIYRGVMHMKGRHD